MPFPARPALVTLLLGGALCAQAPPAVDVDAGPLLCFTTNTLPAKPSEVSLHVVPLAGDAAPVVLWKNGDNANVLARLDRDHLLLASYGNPYALVVVDLRGGTHRVLAEGAPHEFVAVRGEDVLHLGDPRAAANDNFLYASPWAAAGERRRLAEQRFANVAQVQGNLAVAIAENAAAVWIVSLTNATGRAVWTPPAGAHSLREALSPGGQRLAIGCVQADGHALLTVVDVGTAAVVRSWSGLPIAVSHLSSSTPCLEVGWHDDAEVVNSETRGGVNGVSGSFVFVRRSLASGEVTGEEVYAPLGLHHRAPPAPGPEVQRPAAAFTTDVVDGTTRLLRNGRTEPLATFARDREQYGDVRIAPDGQSAVAHLGADKRRCTLFTAEHPDGRLLVEGFAYDVRWLPAAASAAGR